MVGGRMPVIHPFTIIVLQAPSLGLTLYFFGITLLNIFPISGAVSSAVTRSASPWDGSTAASTLWRSLAHRVKDVENLLTRAPSQPVHGRALIDHLGAASRAATSLPQAVKAVDFALIARFERVEIRL